MPYMKEFNAVKCFCEESSVSTENSSHADILMVAESNDKPKLRPESNSLRRSLIMVFKCITRTQLFKTKDVVS